MGNMAEKWMVSNAKVKESLKILKGAFFREPIRCVDLLNRV